MRRIYTVIGCKPAKMYHDTGLANDGRHVVRLRSAEGNKLTAIINEAETDDWPSARAAIVRYLNKDGITRATEDQIQDGEASGDLPWHHDRIPQPLDGQANVNTSDGPITQRVRGIVRRNQGQNYYQHPRGGDAGFSRKSNADYLRELSEANFDDSRDDQDSMLKEVKSLADEAHDRAPSDKSLAALKATDAAVKASKDVQYGGKHSDAADAHFKAATAHVEAFNGQKQPDIARIHADASKGHRQAAEYHALHDCGAGFHIRDLTRGLATETHFTAEQIQAQIDLNKRKMRENGMDALEAAAEAATARQRAALLALTPLGRAVLASKRRA